MTIVPPINSNAISKTGKSIGNFVGSPKQIQHNKHTLKKYKEWVTKHYNSVFDMSTVSNLPGKVHLEPKENATPYQAPVCRAPQTLCKPLKTCRPRCAM